MKHHLSFALGLGLALILPLSAAEKSKKSSKALKTQKEKISYSIGMDVGRALKQQGFEVDTAVVAEAMKTIYTGGSPLLTEEEARQAMLSLRDELMAKQAEMGGKTRQEGQAFLEANKKKEGVKTLPSGLQYKILKEGKGKSPKATDTVTVHYRGTFIDGTVFDSSYDRNAPATFPLNQVIPGWTEGLQLMKEGSKWQLFIPSDLAYGEQGRGAKMPPNSTLLFDVELISVGDPSTN